MARTGPGHSQEPGTLSGLLHGCQRRKCLGLFQCFLRTRTGSWLGDGFPKPSLLMKWQADLELCLPTTDPRLWPGPQNWSSGHKCVCKTPGTVHRHTLLAWGSFPSSSPSALGTETCAWSQACSYSPHCEFPDLRAQGRERLHLHQAQALFFHRKWVHSKG